MVIKNAAEKAETRYLRAIDLMHLSYNALLFVLLCLFRHRQHNWMFYLLIHGCLFAGIWLFIKHTREVKVGVFRLIRDWYTPLVFIFYYEETEYLNHLIIGHYLDPFFVHLEHWVFGMQPSLLFYPAVPWSWFSELMHLSYFFYYCLIPILGFALWLRRDRYSDYHRFLFSYGLVMLFCYTYYIIFPVAGPKFHFPEAEATVFPGFVFTPILTVILEHGAVANGAFPSSHVAMATVIVLCAFQFHKKIFVWYLPLVIGLYFSTVYLQAHYAVDVIAGIVLGVSFYLVADKVRVFLERRLKFLIPLNGCTAQQDS